MRITRMIAALCAAGLALGLSNMAEAKPSCVKKAGEGWGITKASPNSRRSKSSSRSRATGRSSRMRSPSPSIAARAATEAGPASPARRSARSKRQRHLCADHRNVRLAVPSGRFLLPAPLKSQSWRHERTREQRTDDRWLGSTAGGRQTRARRGAGERRTRRPRCLDRRARR